MVPISQVKFESVTRSLSVYKIGDPPIKMQGFILLLPKFKYINYFLSKAILVAKICSQGPFVILFV